MSFQHRPCGHCGKLADWDKCYPPRQDWRSSVVWCGGQHLNLSPAVSIELCPPLGRWDCWQFCLYCCYYAIRNLEPGPQWPIVAQVWNSVRTNGDHLQHWRLSVPRSVQIRCQPPPPKKELRQCALGSLVRQCASGSLDNVGPDPADNEAGKHSHLSSVSSIRICLPPTFQFIHVWSMTIIWKCSMNYGVKIASELRSSWASRCTSCRGTTPRRMRPRSRSTEEQKNALAATSLSTPWRGWGVSLRVRSFWASLSLLTIF